MKALKTREKQSRKDDRKFQVLLGAVHYFIETGKAVGSDSLKNTGFENLSSATIRNYFAELETEGFLIQTHTSGGRIPTSKGFKVYALEHLNAISPPSGSFDPFKELESEETKEIAGYLQKAAGVLSDTANTAVFLSAPRFDQDYIIDIKLVPIDHAKVLAVIVTDFGVVQTELLHTPKKLSAFSAKRIESYFHFRLTGRNLPENLDDDEAAFALALYNELIVRYIVGYTHFTEGQVIRTGFSKLLTYADFQDTRLLANSLALFENVHSMRLLLKECAKQNRLKLWTSDDLKSYTEETPECAVIAIPYYINNQSVGAIGLLGPLRMPYPKVFELLTEFSHAISLALTRNIYKYKISFRQPKQELKYSQFMLLENQMKENK